MNDAHPGSEWSTSGVELLVGFDRGRVDLRRAAHLKHVPQMHLRPPALTEDHLEDLQRGQTEVVLSILDSDGATLESIGMAWQGRRYVDAGDPRLGTIRGGPRPVGTDELDIRALRVPWSDQVSTLFFHRSEVVETPQGLEVRHESLIAYHSGSVPGRPIERLPHDLLMPRVDPMPWAPPWEKKPRPLPWPGPDVLPADGQFVDATTPVQTGDPASRFDIVITGDGFQAGELPQFDQLASRLMSGLQSMAPFNAMASLINWHIVRVTSIDSGIDRCPDPQAYEPPKRTFYQVEGCWDGTDCPGFLGTNEPSRIEWAAEHVAPWEDIDLVIVIANCRVWGGHAWPDWKTAIVSIHSGLFVELAAHECGHVISRLAEEYIACVEEKPCWPDPNLTRMPAVGKSIVSHLQAEGVSFGPVPGTWIVQDTVWWKKLAHPEELYPNGSFVAMHLYGDPVDPNDHKRPAVSPGQEYFVGAFWGCQNVRSPAELMRLISRLSSMPVKGVQSIITVLRALLGLTAPGLSSTNPNSCNFYWDPRGASYFRSSAVCRMRYPSYGFCRVCQHLISNSIREASGVALVGPMP